MTVPFLFAEFAMPRKSVVGPSGAEKLRVWSNQENWPKGSGFHEESFPNAHPHVYRACAQRFAEQIAAGERAVYVKAVAREATKRVLCRHLFEQPNRELLTGYVHESKQAEVSYRDQITHVQHMRRELAWERHKWSVQHNTFQWRRYKYDPQFLCWLQSVPALNLARWSAAYLVDRLDKLSVMRQDLAQLAPMPQEIRKAHFFATTENQQLLTMSGAEVDLGPATEHHVILVCQRLLAYHTVENARHGPAHLAHLTKMLERHLTFRRSDHWSAQQLLDIVSKAGVFSQGRVTKLEVDGVMVRVESALQRARAVLGGQVDLQAELTALRPSHLELREPCPTCVKVKEVTPEETQLPPFHPRCQCFRLAWRSSEVPELDRKVRLWSLECALGGDRTPQFPFDEFISACEALRVQAQRPSVLVEITPTRPVAPWPHLRPDSRTRARMMWPLVPGQGPPDGMLAVSTVAAWLGVGQRYVRDLCAEGKLGQVVLTEGGHRRIPSSGVEAYLKVRASLFVPDAEQRSSLALQDGS